MIPGLKRIDPGTLKRIGSGPIRDEPGLQKIAPNADAVLRRKFEKQSARNTLQVKNAVEAIGSLPTEGEVLHLLMDGRFHGWSFIAATLELANGAAIDELLVATLGFNEANSGQLMSLIDAGQIRKVWFLCSCYMRDDNTTAIYANLMQMLTDRGHRLKAARNHAKVLAMKLSDGRHIVIDGSMNLRSCKSVEQVNIWNSQKLFDHYAGYIKPTVESDEWVK